MYTTKYKDLKNEILKFAHERPEHEEIQAFPELIEQIHNFAKSYRRRPKPLRRIPDKNSPLSDPVEDHELPSAVNHYSSDEDSEDEILRFEEDLERFEDINKQEER